MNPHPHPHWDFFLDPHPHPHFFDADPQHCTEQLVLLDTYFPDPLAYAKMYIRDTRSHRIFIVNYYVYFSSEAKCYIVILYVIASESNIFLCKFVCSAHRAKCINKFFVFFITMPNGGISIRCLMKLTKLGHIFQYCIYTPVWIFRITLAGIKETAL